MSAPQSPITSLLAWLTVSMFLLTGAPAKNQADSLQENLQRVAATNALAKTFAALDQANSQGTKPLPLLKLWDLVDAPSSGLFATPDFPLPKELRACRAAPLSVHRLSLVGSVELRI